MRPSRRWRWLTALVLGAGLTGLAGCKSSHTFPADPLLVSKKPIEVKAQAAPPAKVASGDLVAPPSRVNLVAACSAHPRPNPFADSTTIDPPLPARPRPAGDSPREAPALTQVRASSAAPGQ
jgi:hypothetical protein